MLVVDTDVISYLFKQDTRGDLYKPHLHGHLLVISPMTRAELEDWALEHNWGQRRRDEMRVHLKQLQRGSSVSQRGGTDAPPEQPPFSGPQEDGGDLAQLGGRQGEWGHITAPHAAKGSRD